MLTRPKGFNSPADTDDNPSKKRPFSQNTPSSIAKRPSTKCGFLLSSDEDDESTDEDEDDCRLVSSEPLHQKAVIPPKTPASMQKPSPAEPIKVSLSTKQVNKARLNALLGKNGKLNQTMKKAFPSTSATPSRSTAFLGVNASSKAQEFTKPEPTTTMSIKPGSCPSKQPWPRDKSTTDNHEVNGITAMALQKTVRSQPSIVVPSKLQTKDLKSNDRISIASEKVSEAVPDRLSSPPVSDVAPDMATDVSSQTIVLSQLSELSRDAQPYFEYSIFRKDWSSEQDEKNALTKEIIVRPFTNMLEANTQAERYFESEKQHSNYLVAECSTGRDEHGCIALTSSIAPFDYPTHKHYTKIYVQRDSVSRLANQTPQSLKDTTFIASTGYALRLFKLIEISDAVDYDSSDSDSDSPKTTASEPVRTYRPHDCAEVYTTLEAANRAARNLQVQLSHEKDPKDAMTRAFQEQDLKNLNAKIRKLESAGQGENSCWQSKFNACGLGGDNFELVVEKIRICGPRNI